MTKRVITSNLPKLSRAHQRNAKRLPLAVAKGFTEIATESIGLYQKTTRTWKRQPKFYAERTARGVTVNTDSQIFQWVDEGTKGPYPIVAKRAKFLHFFSPYRAATKPRVIASYQARYGNVENFRRRVMHPGIKPRKFTDEISKRMQKRAAGIMRKHINEAISMEGA